MGKKYYLALKNWRDLGIYKGALIEVETSMWSGAIDKVFIYDDFTNEEWKLRDSEIYTFETSYFVYLKEIYKDDYKFEYQSMKRKAKIEASKSIPTSSQAQSKVTSGRGSVRDQGYPQTPDQGYLKVSGRNYVNASNYPSSSSIGSGHPYNTRSNVVVDHPDNVRPGVQQKRLGSAVQHHPTPAATQDKSFAAAVKQKTPGSAVQQRPTPAATQDKSFTPAPQLGQGRVEGASSRRQFFEPPRCLNVRCTKTIDVPSIFSLQVNENVKLKLGDLVTFQDILGIVRWISMSGKIGWQLFDEDFGGKITEGVRFGDIELALTDGERLTPAKDEKRRYFLAKGSRLPKSEGIYPALYAYYQSHCFDLESSEVKRLYQHDIEEGKYPYFVEITEKHAAALFHVKDRQRRLETMLTGQLGLIDAEARSTFVMRVQSDDPQEADFSGEGTIAGGEGGFLDVEINGERSSVTIDEVFDLANPPLWVEGTDEVMKGSRFERDNIVSVSLGSSLAFGFLKIMAEPLPGTIVAVVESFFEVTGYKMKCPRMMIPYLPSFRKNVKKTLVVPEKDIFKTEIFMINDKLSEADNGKLVAIVGDRKFDISNESRVIISYGEKVRIADDQVAYYANIKDREDRLWTYHLGHHKDIHDKPRQGSFVKISPQVNANPLEFQRNEITEIMYKDGLVIFFDGDQTKETSIDEIFDLNAPIASWMSSDVTTGAVRTGKVVKLSNNDSYGVLKAVLRLPWGKEVCVIEYQDPTQGEWTRIPRQVIPFLDRWEVKLDHAAVAPLSEIKETEIILLLETSQSRNIEFPWGSILAKERFDEYRDLESHAIFRTSFPSSTVVKSSHLPFLLKIEDKRQRVLVHYCNQLQILDLKPTPTSVVFRDEDNFVKGKLKSFEDGLVVIEVDGNTIKTTIDNVYHPPSSPSWLRGSIMTGDFKQDDLVIIKATNSPAIVKSSCQLSRTMEIIYIVEPVTEVELEQYSRSHLHVVPYLRHDKLLTPDTVLLRGTDIMKHSGTTHYITHKTKQGSFPGTLWQVHDGFRFTLESDELHRASMGFVKEISSEIATKLEKTTRRDRLHKYNSMKSGVSVETRMPLASHESEPMRSSPPVDDKASAQQSQQMKRDPDDRETAGAAAAKGSQETRYFISITKDEEEYASIGTLWICEGDGDPRVASQEGKGTIGKVDDLLQISADQFHNLLEMENKGDRLKRLSIWDRKAVKTGTEPMDCTAPEEAANEGKGASETKDDHVQKAKERIPELMDVDKEDTLPESSSNWDKKQDPAETVNQSNDIPSWIVSYDKNWDEYGFEEGSVVAVMDQGKIHFPMVFGILRAILQSPMGAALAVVEEFHGRLDALNILDDPVNKFLPRIFPGCDHLRAFSINSIQHFPVFLTMRMIQTDTEAIPTGSIILEIQEDVFYNFETSVQYKLNSIHFETHRYDIRSTQLPRLLRINDRQSRVEVVLTERLSFLQYDTPVLVLNADNTTDSGEFIREIAGKMEVKVHDGIRTTTLENIFPTNENPKWLATFVKCPQSKFKVEFKGAKHIMRGTVTLPWESEESVVMEIVKGIPKDGSIPKSVIPYLEDLNVEKEDKAVLAPLSQVVFPKENLGPDADGSRQHPIEDASSRQSQSKPKTSGHSKQVGTGSGERLEKLDRHFLAVQGRRPGRLWRRRGNQMISDDGEESQEIEEGKIPNTLMEIDPTHYYTLLDIRDEKQRVERYFAVMSHPSESQVGDIGMSHEHDDGEGGRGGADHAKKKELQKKPKLFEVGDFVELKEEPHLRGFIRCIFDTSSGPYAGIELDHRYSGSYSTSKRFFCPEGFGIFKSQADIVKATREPRLENVTERTPPITAEDLPSLIGDDRGIQGESNSCYLDSLIFCLFAFHDTLDTYEQMENSTWANMARNVFWQGVVFPLRKNYFVRREKIQKLRQVLVEKSGKKEYRNEYRDLPETISLLFGEILGTNGFLKIKSEGKINETFCLETLRPEGDFKKNPVFTSQLYFEYSSMIMKFQISELPQILILQIPRERGYSNIVVPSLFLDPGRARYDPEKSICVKCGLKATHYNEGLFDERGLESTFLCQYCAKFSATRVEKIPREEKAEKKNVNEKLKLSAVICIEKSHYNCFVRCGDDDWIFFDSMSDQKEEDDLMVNVPKVTRVEVSSWIREALNTPREKLLETIKEKDSVKDRLFRYPYAIVYRRS